MEDRACRVDFVGDPPSSTFYPRLVELQPGLKQLGRELRIEDGGWIAGVLSRDSLSSILVSSTPIPPPSRISRAHGVKLVLIQSKRLHVAAHQVHR